MSEVRDTFYQYPIPATSAFPFEPVLLVHRVLSIRPASGEGAWPARFNYFQLNLDHEIDPGFDISAYVQNLQANPTPVPVDAPPEGPYSGEADTPWDINPQGQCYLVLELDSQINWEYGRGSRAVASKAFYPEENANLVVVDARGLLHGPADDLVVPSPGCRVLYFHLVMRQPQPPPNGTVERSFNFIVDFLFEDSSGRRVYLPTIFDPTVPNSGGASFP